MFGYQRLNVFKFILLLTTATAIAVLLASSSSFTNFQERFNLALNGGNNLLEGFKVPDSDSVLPPHVNECLPFYDFFDQNLTREVKPSSFSEFTPLAAYTFPTYSAVTLQSYGKLTEYEMRGRKVYCWYKDDQLRPVGDPVESIAFPWYTVYCCKHPRDRYIGVSTDEKNSSGVTYEEVIVRTENGTKYTLSHCHPPLYGNLSSWLLLTELIEHYLLYGVQHFYIYVSKMDSYSRRVLDDYVNTGEVEAIFYRQGDNITQASAIMDCLIRSRYHSSYVIMSDLDERIVTGNANESLASLVLSTMERHKNVGSITFQSRYVFRTVQQPPTYKGEQTLREHLPTLVFDNTTLTGAGIRRKCIIDPHRVLEMKVHKVRFFLGNYINFKLSLSVGYVMHYRDPFLGISRTNFLQIIETSGTFETIEYPEHLIGQLFKNVQTRLDRVYKEDLMFSSRQQNCQSVNSTATKL